MDFFAHLFLGYILYYYFKNSNIGKKNTGKKELAFALFGSVAPDIFWIVSGNYRLAHIFSYYLLILPFLIFPKIRFALVLFLIASFLHIIIDAFIHKGSWFVFYPLNFSISGFANYWEEPWIIFTYWLGLIGLYYLLTCFKKLA
jgi:hypothetical protein